MAKVSVIIPVYNVEQYLARCLESVCGQTEGDLEIICVDDGSTDSSASILREWANKDKRICIISKANGGLSSARNAGLNVASCEYVAFVDSDDFIPTDAFAKMLAAAQVSSAPIVVSSQCAINSLLLPRLSSPKLSLEKPALEKMVANRHIHSSAWNKLFRRDVIGDIRFIDGIFFEDWPFNLMVFAQVPFFAMLDEPMYVYCSAGPSIVRSSFSLKKADSYIKGIREVSRFFAKRSDIAAVQKRCAVAVKMLVSKTVKAKDNAISSFVRHELGDIFKDGFLRRRDLDLKTRWRLFRL